MAYNKISNKTQQKEMTNKSEYQIRMFYSLYNKNEE